MPDSTNSSAVSQKFDLIRHDFVNQLSVFVGHIQLHLERKLGTSSFDADNPPPADIVYAAIQSVDPKHLRTFDERYINDPALSTSIMYRELALQFKKDHPEIVRELNTCIKTLRKPIFRLTRKEAAYRKLWEITHGFEKMSLPPSRQDLEKYNNGGIGNARELLTKPSL